MNCVHTADADTTKQFRHVSGVYTPRRDETRQFRLVGVGGVYWALDCLDCWTAIYSLENLQFIFTVVTRLTSPLPVVCVCVQISIRF